VYRVLIDKGGRLRMHSSSNSSTVRHFILGNSGKSFLFAIKASISSCEKSPPVTTKYSLKGKSLNLCSLIFRFLAKFLIEYVLNTSTAKFSFA